MFLFVVLLLLFFQGISSISDYAIGFHYTSPQVIYLLEYLVYHLRPYGVRFADLDLNKRLS